jgi:TonB family protein
VGAPLLLGFALLVQAGSGKAQTAVSTTPPGLTQREMEDPLEPWSLEPGRGPFMPPPSPPPLLPTPPAALPESTQAGAPEGEASLPVTEPPEPVPSEPEEQVVVVQCRQLLVSDPRQAQRLAELLHAGVTLEDARRGLGSIDIDETTRSYALDELQPELRAEIDTLAEGGWGGLREWRGRSALFQLVTREERARNMIPALGEGLDAAELERLANRQRALGSRAPSAAAPPAADAQPATVVEKATPQYPEGITESADVTVQVEIGLSDDYLGARIVSSTNAQFDQSALDAAQRSTYRSARRNGVPERGTVTINFRFVAPGQPSPDPGRPPD